MGTVPTEAPPDLGLPCTELRAEPGHPAVTKVSPGATRPAPDGQAPVPTPNGRKGEREPRQPVAHGWWRGARDLTVQTAPLSLSGHQPAQGVTAGQGGAWCPTATCCQQGFSLLGVRDP